MKNDKNLICFDLDGVIISSMEIAVEIYKEVMESELGLTSDLFDDKKFFALSPEDKFEAAWGDKNISQSEINRVLDIYREGKMNANIPLKPYAKDAIKLISDNFDHVVVVSSNKKYVIEDTLKKHDLISYFENITGTDGVEDSKPAPDIYQKAAKDSNIPPNFALTLEDSSHGVMSAKSAGMKAIGVATGLENTENLKKAGADLVLNDLSELTLEMVNSLF